VRCGVWTLFVLWILTFILVFSLRFVNPPFTFMTAWNWIRHNEATRHYQPKTHWRPLNKISPHLRKAVLAGEDQRFLSHRGFDFTELNQAIKEMALSKGTRGASTLTMQVARTVFLWPKRSWLRKAAEAYYTVLIEIFWSKERILEIYLNTVDWGSGLMGAESASSKYFHRSSASISPHQAALLAAILPNPDKLSPTRPSAWVLMRQKRILKDMKKMPLLN
jgi:monofunctional biosynthetic peptidoglycan transglycosylase